MARTFHPGMGQAVAERTILRKKKNNQWETWDDVAHRVALGNSLLCKTKEEQEAEYKILYKHLSKASILMSGRHLQHGDATQPERNMEVYTNCSTSCTSFALFYLLMNGSGVGRSYDDDIILINWDNAPDVRCVLDDSHADFDYSAHESVRDAKHKYGNGKDVLWHMVDDTREGWAKALELWENAAFEKIHKDKLLILDFSKVRPKGSPIAGMQGRPASGPVPLMNAFMKALTIKNSGLPKFMQSMYIDHYFAECVLVGGARRAARMSTKYWKDQTIFDFITIKRPIEYCDKLVDEIVDLRSSLKIKPNGFLWSSNNSIMVDKEFWTLLHLKRKDAEYNSPLAKHARKVFKLATSAAYGDGTGEPGFINVDKLTTKSEGIDKLQNGEILGSKKYQVSDDTNLYLRRLVKKALKKPYYMIVNPCGEVVLALWGAFCTIGDGVPYHADTIEEAEEAFRAIVRALIRVNTMDSIYHNEVKRTNRIGVGITGVHEFAWKFFKLGFRDLVDEEKSKEFWATLSRFKRAIQEEAAAYAKKYDVVIPHTDTTIKPAGCRPWDALVTTNSGILNLQELFKDHEDGNAWSEYSGKECAIQDNGVEKPLIRTFYNGKAKVKSIKMRYGLTVTSTLNHPWFVKSRRIGKREEIVNNWINTEDIKCGDILDIKLGVYQNDKHSEFKKLNTFAIKMNGNCIEIKQPKILNPNLAWFFGYLWGDGAQSPQKYRLRWTEEKISILNKVKDILREEFGLESTINECSDKNAFSLEVGNKILWNWLIVNNIWKYQEDRIDFIPKIIRTSSKEDIIAFISGMIDSDGACSVSKSNKNKVYITQHDKSFTNHLQHVCWSVGLGFGCSHNTCGENFQQPRKDMYIMTLGKAVDKESFKLLVDNSIKLKNASKNIWHHESKAQNDAIIGMVLSVKDAGEEDTFDVEVADNHWFYAGSVKSHNTNSKLFGLTEGWHLPSMRWYMRWVQFSESDPLVKVYEKNGYPVKHLKQYKNTVIVGFPTTPIITELGMGEAIVTAAEATPEEQYKWISFGEKYWIHGVDEEGIPLVSNTGNQISYTLKYDPKIVDYKGFTKTLKEWQSKVKCCSIMPQEEKSSYEYLPEQLVTKAEYESVMNNIKRVLEEDVDFAHVDCSTGACPVNFNK